MIGRSIIAAVMLAACAAAAPAQQLVTSVSSHQVLINSSYTGDELVIFGSIEQVATPPRQGSDYDIVITVTGPRENLVTRRKERVLGIWANVGSREFLKVPSYLAILTTRPIDTIASPDTLRRYQIGLDNTILTQRVGFDVGDVVRDDPFRQAFVRVKTSQGLYLEQQGAVTFLSPHLFRADIPIPAQVLLGTYQVNVKLFADGKLLTQDNSTIDVRKIGFEQFVAAAAREDGLLYGLATALMALATGWFASIVFRRD